MIEQHAKLLTEAGDSLDAIKANFAAIAADARDVLADLKAVVGDDHFGRKFMDGDEGLKTRVAGVIQATKNVSTTSGSYSEGQYQAAKLLSGTDDASGAEISKAV